MSAGLYGLFGLFGLIGMLASLFTVPIAFLTGSEGDLSSTIFWNTFPPGIRDNVCDDLERVAHTSSVFASSTSGLDCRCESFGEAITGLVTVRATVRHICTPSTGAAIYCINGQCSSGELITTGVVTATPFEWSFIESRGGSIEGNLKYTMVGDVQGPNVLVTGVYGNTIDRNGPGTFTLDACTFGVGSTACTCDPAGCTMRTATITCPASTALGTLSGFSSGGCVNPFYGG